nr:MAG TPA: hypothetical protein [Caudoviricetes sp.]
MSLLILLIISSVRAAMIFCKLSIRGIPIDAMRNPTSTYIKPI